MANCGLPLFQGYLYMREEGGEAEMQRPGFLSEKTNTEKTPHFCDHTKENARTAQIFSSPSTSNDLIIQQINSPLCRSCLVDTANTSETRAPDLLFLMSL